MRKLIFLTALVLFTGPGFSQDISPVIAVLGMTHLHNPGADAVNMDVGDIHSEKRQQELAELIDILLEFKPTKIAIESPFADSNWSEAYFQYYLNNELESNLNDEEQDFLSSEIVQLAYPLAKRMDHLRLYGIDAFTSFDINSVIEYGQENKLYQQMADVQELRGKSQNTLDEISSESILDIINFVNSEYFAKELNQNFYLQHLIAFGDGDNYIGTDVVAEWYSRNLRILTNLNRIVEPGDRILVIFGAGHRDILVDFISDRVDWNYFDINQILVKKKTDK